LLRRLSLDLIGLPPTIREIDDFLADKNPDAFEKVRERLLASPHYGERWGRQWLDVARYADSNGYEKDLSRSIWPYRDWVIDAFNRDLPFNQFVLEQLAGDLLPGATLSQRVATGFLRNSMLNEEGGVDPEQFRVEGLIDRMDALGKSFLGLTINCAQCHNHKYDPISQREYYQLFAFLNNDDEPEMEVPTAAQQAKRNEILQQIATLDDNLFAGDPEIGKRMAQWENEMRQLPRPWTVLDPDAFYAAVGTKLTKLKDQSLLATASSPPNSSYTISVKTTLTNITGFRLEVLRDPNLPAFGPGRAKNGNFVLTQFTVEAAPMNEPDKTNHVGLQNASADLSQKSFPVSAAIEGLTTNKSGWSIDGGPLRRNQNHEAVFETIEPVGFEPGTILTFTLKQSFGQQNTIGRLRLSATSGARPVRANPLGKDLRAILDLPGSQRSKEQQRQLFAAFRAADEKLVLANGKVEELMKDWPVAPTTLVLQPREEPRESHIFKRGDFMKPGDAVAPGVPAILNPLPQDSPLNRLTLAKWIVDKKNPTAARVVVNRIWQAYFGRGLVTTAEDLGTQGERPSHPDLLDWLACELMEPVQALPNESSPVPWSLKHIHRLIASSETYRQSSRVSPSLYEKDQYNRLLARGPRFRVEGEIVRDIALAASGLLSEKIGGPPTFPPIPEGVLNLGYDIMKWPTATGEERYRRGLYTFWKRSVPYPALSVFDVPNADVSCPRRVRSNTPLQALTTLNDILFQEAAQALALRVYKEGGDDAARAKFGFRLCTAREPRPAEMKSILDLLEDQKNYFENRSATAIKVALGPAKNLDEDLSIHKLAAWTIVSRVLLNLDETLSKE
jgi:hypothetical protein